MNILILSFRAGEGHNAAAKAILERIEHEGHSGEILDFLGIFSEKISTVINDSYVSVVRHAPAIFGACYKTSLSISKHLKDSHSAIYQSSVVVAKKLLEYLQTHDFDAVICTHLMPAQAMSYLKEQGHKVPFSIAVATDYTFYPFWEEAIHCDRYIIPHEDMISEYISRGIPAEKLCPFGIPIGMRCLDLPSKKEAREKLGLPPKTMTFLVMGGSMGAGHIRTFTKKLYHNLGRAHMVVICGKNVTLKHSLDHLFAGKKNVHIIGFTDQVPLYMRACDLLYTKPGGLTSSEALACNVPLVHTTPIPGCESDNFSFFSDHGCSLPAKTVNEQVNCGLYLMRNPRELDIIRKAQEKCAKPLASLDILNMISEAVGK